jgi:hypothetical protein
MVRVGTPLLIWRGALAKVYECPYLFGGRWSIYK